MRASMSACLLTLLTATSLPADVRYARDVAPVLARHCFECHGPDAVQRQAGLRLDQPGSATAKLESGHIAVVARNPEQSELVRRILARGESRMPPPEAGDALTEDEIETIIEWVRSGAEWEIHWAFSRPTLPTLPAVSHADWCQNPVDQFILSRLEQAGLQPLAKADRATLIRRVYFDMLGIPPRPDKMLAFLADDRPDAWERLVDRLLASPLYGQRWGRHWLDVARYGDSNGGDENHAYPLAWRYRDYVIGAFNDGLPFDEFVREQIAGDLLDADSPRRAARVTATGFLALGTKILAERDKVKMRADLVDEQIDTLGRAFLGLTLGCARCHDHKFDPIPTTDYYALAGIFHSTSLGDQPVSSAEYERAKAEYDRQLATLNSERESIERLLSDKKGNVLDRQAESFNRGNVSRITDGYGKGIGVISDPGAQQNFAEFDLDMPDGGRFLIQLRYAAENSRPGRILVNGKVVRERAITEATGGWYPEHQRWHSEGTHEFQSGRNVLRIESAPLMSHIDRFRMIRIEAGSDLAAALDRLETFEKRINRFTKTAPQPVKVMAATDENIGNVRVHQRGSHLSLGDEVPRGFPGISAAWSFGKSDPSRRRIEDSNSGRLELADWLTDVESGAGLQTARVIANRVWHWHFGRGLVGTPDNFGLQGERPTHPELLDWLAADLIASDWSLKSLHRRILLSATYQQVATRDHNQFYHGVPRRRLDAESIRDSLLFHADRLDESLVGEPLQIKSQDPSPEDLQRNAEFYRSSRRRSVYLPVVRSNVYRFLSLFDFPNAATPVGRRDSTVVPTQALLLMNDPFVMDQAAAIARRIRFEAKTERGRASLLYAMLFSREPTAAEMKLAGDFLLGFAATTSSDESGELAAWAALCHTLISSSEFIYVE